MEVSIWQKYKDEGLVVWAIAGADDYDSVVSFASQMGLTYPVLYDGFGVVLDEYSQLTAFSNTIYPQDWVIGVDGTITYFSNTYDVEGLKAVIETELDKTAH